MEPGRVFKRWRRSFVPPRHAVCEWSKASRQVHWQETIAGSVGQGLSSPRRLEVPISMERHMQAKILQARILQAKIFVPMMLLVVMALPVAAQAQGTVRGAQEGAAQGERNAGPIGAVVGGALGAVAGTVGGILGVEDRPRFREYVVRERLPSYRYSDEFRVGAVLPDSGVTYYEVPAEYHAPAYRYTYVNDRPVLVDPRTRRIVEIIE